MGRLEAVYRDVWRRLAHRAGSRDAARDFQVEFRPYAGLTSRIDASGDPVMVRLSDVLRDAPLRVHESLAFVLIDKVRRGFVSLASERAPYDEFVARPEVRTAHVEARRARSRPRMRGPVGDAHDLQLLYRRLNREYFGAMLPSVELGWSERRSRTRFGYHDTELGAIVINRRLDDAAVPERVVAYVLYHEMLHVKHGIGVRDDGSRSLHPAAFKRDERLFPAYRSADAFLGRLAASRPPRKRLRRTRS